MRREVTDLIGSGLILAALVTATFAVLAPASGAGTAASPPVAITSEAMERGRLLFYAKGCVTCHTKAGEIGAIGEVGPDLTGLASRAATRRPGMSAEKYVHESMEAPSAFIAPGFEGGTAHMPDLGLSDDEIAALAAFLLGTP